MPIESNRWFGLITSGVWRGVSEGDAGGCFLCGQNVSDVWVDVEEETTASNDCIGCNVKPFRVYSFMTATKK